MRKKFKIKGEDGLIYQDRMTLKVHGQGYHTHLSIMGLVANEHFVLTGRKTLKALADSIYYAINKKNNATKKKNRANTIGLW